MTETRELSLNDSGRRFAMSVDVEDYFQVWAFSDIIARESWDGFPLRVGETTRACLDLFDTHNTKATFFTLGWVAERDPALIREIVDRGHELASHGWDHTKVDQQSHEQFRSDIQKTKSLLEDISGTEVKGYRAAGFSINKKTPWAYEELASSGYRYSSSAHPIAHDHYGDVNAERSPYTPLPNNHFIEAPVATVDLWGRRISAAGGGWFRAAPLPVYKSLLSRASASLEGPAIFYFHPWEIDPEQPRMNRASMKSKVRHYLGLNRMKNKLANILSAYRWIRIDSALQIGETV
ncbi:DUF3473 domain-containing protein [Hyphococcus flavus]|uniref:Chitooligosaccharide deacetylase n=1 Tax=Hyphococcus flavus TaxID=1866326 RepID=A0AAE9ZJZ7_9PROT|nr:XrtA system polysaccharide deacetylase [Hyphococcus flavus]WDI32010.1 DUF3473 domain-containing protein [Hyphococcus flavus]